MSALAFDQILNFGKCALMFIGSAWRSETKPECISPQIERQCARFALIFRQQARFWGNFVEEFADRQRVPHLDSLIGQAGHENARRQQQDFGARVGVVGRDDRFVEIDAGELGHQPAAQRPG